VTGILILGFLIGLRHALEADHVAAVAALASRSPSAREAWPLGALWGLGHTVTLFIVGGVVFALSAAIPEDVSRYLELLVGVMLVLLGADVLYRVVHDRVHFHHHRHGDGVTHFHAHSHAGETSGGHDPASHCHRHRMRIRAALVGMMHGLTGSAALVILTAQAAPGLSGGLIYIALFGAGSIAGMAVLSVIIAAPLAYAARSLTWTFNGLKGAVGLSTVTLGLVTIYHSGIAPLA